MAPITITTTAVSSMMGVVIGYFLHEAFGARRSSIGIHRSSGKLLPFYLAVPFFALFLISAGVVSSVISNALIEGSSGLEATIVSVLLLSLFLSVDSYSR